MLSEYAIEIDGLGKCYQIYAKPSDRLKQMLFRGKRQYYQEFWALRDVSLRIRKGETVGVIGRNGSGKSTLLQMICGTLNPTLGEIKVNGRVAALLELGAGFNPEFSGLENVYMAASLYGLTKEDVDLRLDKISAFADIGDHIYQPVKTYSSGMYVRLAFAVIAHVDADILVIDEALAVGDAFFTQKCMRFLRDFMAQGTVLFVSHDTSAVINLCDTAVWLNHGRMIAVGVPKTIAEDYLASLYDTQVVRREPISDQRHVKNAVVHDPRWEKINASSLRNTLEVFSFDAQNTSEFGHGGAVIDNVRLESLEGERILQCVGGEVVNLLVEVRAIEPLNLPIVGFSLKDRLGQVLFGDNTYITYQDQSLKVDKGEHMIARFQFQMPILPHGDYCMAVAVATGTQEDHRQEHWVHDALVIRSLSSSVSTGLVGVPMHKISLEKMECQ